MSQQHPSGLTCIHAGVGLCESCQAEYDYDPQAWIDYGHHPAGIAAWERLQDEIAADRPPVYDDTPLPVYDGEIPF